MKHYNSFPPKLKSFGWPEKIALLPIQPRPSSLSGTNTVFVNSHNLYYHHSHTYQDLYQLKNWCEHAII